MRWKYCKFYSVRAKPTNSRYFSSNSLGNGRLPRAHHRTPRGNGQLFEPAGRGRIESETMQRMKRFDLQPHLVGELVELRPLRRADWDELFEVAGDPLIWEVHPARDRYKEEIFNEYFQEALESEGALVVPGSQKRQGYRCVALFLVRTRSR